jgi:hypothetical protein
LSLRCQLQSQDGCPTATATTAREYTAGQGNEKNQHVTNDREKLGAALGHDVSHSSAHAPEMKPEQKQEQAVTPQREIAPEQEQSLDIGLGI